VAASDALCRLLYLIATRGCTPDTDADADTGAEAGTEAAAALWSNMEVISPLLFFLSSPFFIIATSVCALVNL